MIFVNYGGGGYWFFNHSTWNGVTLADLVFPWFVWIMGVSIVFSYKGRRKDSLVSKLYQVVRRTIILFGLGLFLNNGRFLCLPVSSISLPPPSLFLSSLPASPPLPLTMPGFTLSHWRIPGVLQRFAISYFVVALTELLTSDLYRIKHNWVRMTFTQLMNNSLATPLNNYNSTCSSHRLAESYVHFVTSLVILSSW